MADRACEPQSWTGRTAPTGSWRGDGNQYLNPDQHAQANDVIADVGRSEKRLTEYVREAERENAYGGWLEGLGHRLKGEERLKEKIAEILSECRGKEISEGSLREIP